MIEFEEQENSYNDQGFARACGFAVSSALAALSNGDYYTDNSENRKNLVRYLYSGFAKDAFDENNFLSYYINIDQTQIDSLTSLASFEVGSIYEEVLNEIKDTYGYDYLQSMCVVGWLYGGYSTNSPTGYISNAINYSLSGLNSYNKLSYSSLTGYLADTRFFDIRTGASAEGEKDYKANYYSYSYFDLSPSFNTKINTHKLKDSATQFYSISGELYYSNPYWSDIPECDESVNELSLNDSEPLIITGRQRVTPSSFPCISKDDYYLPVTGNKFYRKFADGPYATGNYTSSVTDYYHNKDKQHLHPSDAKAGMANLYDESGLFVGLQAVDACYPVYGQILNQEVLTSPNGDNYFHYGGDGVTRQANFFTGYYPYTINTVHGPVSYTYQPDIYGEFGTEVKTSVYTGIKYVPITLNKNHWSGWAKDVLTNLIIDEDRYYDLSINLYPDIGGFDIIKQSEFLGKIDGIDINYYSGEVCGPARRSIVQAVPSISPADVLYPDEFPVVGFTQDFSSRTFNKNLKLGIQFGRMVNVRVDPRGVNEYSFPYNDPTIVTSDLIWITGEMEKASNGENKFYNPSSQAQAKTTGSYRINSNDYTGSGVNDLNLTKSLSIGNYFEGSGVSGEYSYDINDVTIKDLDINYGLRGVTGILSYYRDGSSTPFKDGGTNYQSSFGATLGTGPRKVKYISGWKKIGEPAIKIQKLYYTDNVGLDFEEYTGYAFHHSSIINTLGDTGFSPNYDDINGPGEMPSFTGLTDAGYFPIYKEHNFLHYHPRYYRGPYSSAKKKFLYPNAQNVFGKYYDPQLGFPNKVSITIEVEEHAVKEVYEYGSINSSLEQAQISGRNVEDMYFPSKISSGEQSAWIGDREWVGADYGKEEYVYKGKPNFVQGYINNDVNEGVFPPYYTSFYESNPPLLHPTYEGGEVVLFQHPSYHGVNYDGLWTRGKTYTKTITCNYVKPAFNVEERKYDSSIVDSIFTPLSGQLKSINFEYPDIYSGAAPRHSYLADPIFHERMVGVKINTGVSGYKTIYEKLDSDTEVIYDIYEPNTGYYTGDISWTGSGFYEGFFTGVDAVVTGFNHSKGLNGDSWIGFSSSPWPTYIDATTYDYAGYSSGIGGYNYLAKFTCASVNPYTQECENEFDPTHPSSEEILSRNTREDNQIFLVNLKPSGIDFHVKALTYFPNNFRASYNDFDVDYLDRLPRCDTYSLMESCSYTGFHTNNLTESLYVTGITDILGIAGQEYNFSGKINSGILYQRPSGTLWTSSDKTENALLDWQYQSGGYYCKWRSRSFLKIKVNSISLTGYGDVPYDVEDVVEPSGYCDVRYAMQYENLAENPIYSEGIQVREQNSELFYKFAGISQTLKEHGFQFPVEANELIVGLPSKQYQTISNPRLINENGPYYRINTNSKNYNKFIMSATSDYAYFNSATEMPMYEGTLTPDYYTYPGSLVFSAAQGQMFPNGDINPDITYSYKVENQRQYYDGDLADSTLNPELTTDIITAASYSNKPDSVIGPAGASLSEILKFSGISV